MQVASSETVLGDFENHVFEHRGVVTRFYRRDGRFMVETTGADGERAEFEVAYTFGVAPLQQYLLGFPDGRYQALTVAWDSRPEKEGGQRWFHLYPDEDIPPGDELHWTAPAHNWNFSCAECHSTRLRKNYDAVTDRYATDWAEIDVGCEACHGPGASHAAAARLAREEGAGYPADHGLVVDLQGAGEWGFEAGDSTAVRRTAGGGASEPELCGRCHARRTQFSEDYVHGRALSDTHRVELLLEDRYFPDGQILDEVYVYGSFVQSRMHAAGVTCSDCHESHSLELRVPGDGVCFQCHAATAYGTVEHHFHPEVSEGARCVSCHMPERTYMVVDPRRDHSMQIPRPDRSEALGTPNVCTGCHAGRTNQWAVEQLDAWYGKERASGFQRYAELLAAARDGSSDAGRGLESLMLDRRVPAIARATALAELSRYLSPSSSLAVRAGLADKDPLVRRAAVELLEQTDRDVRWRLVSPLLDDPVRGVRVAAAWALADVSPEEVEDPQGRQRLQRAFDEYLASEMLNADRVEHWVNMAGFHARQGNVPAAEKAYSEARRRDADFIPVYANQADMYRLLGREADGEKVLREGVARVDAAPALHHALGLLLIRENRLDEALPELERAFELGGENARFGYVYGVALNSTGAPLRAIEVWEAVLREVPGDRATLFSLVSALRDQGDYGRAVVYADRLLELTPADPEARRLRQSLSP
jgi:tetratricopeptide (TPR) repeat protein